VTTTHLGPTPFALMSAERAATLTTFDQFLATAVEYADLWSLTARRAVVPDHLLPRAQAVRSELHLVTLLADWCVDAVSTVPYLVRLVEAMPNATMRCIERDQHLDLMDAHLTGTSRSIPVVIVFDADYRELGWWGPRPAELQEWSLTNHQLPKEERNRYRRTWYARDKGVTTLDEVLTLIERATAPR
jgi:hypothetical protein